MTLEQLLDRGRTRSIFLFGVGLFVVVLWGVRYYVLPNYDATLPKGGLPWIAKLLEDTSTSVVVTILVAVFLWWITPNRVRNANVAVVEPRELKQVFSEALRNTNSWNFSGGCGRYFRSAVLAEMMRRVRQESTIKTVCAIILNPQNNFLCEEHARYRAGTRRGQNEGIWTPVRVKQELLATIIITKAVSHRQSLIDAKIYLSDFFSTFRIDISQVCAIETREDPTAPALRSDSGTYFYDALSDEFHFVRGQAKLVEGGGSECAAVVDLKTLKKAIEVMGLNGLGLNDNDLSEVVSLVKNVSNPYE